MLMGRLAKRFADRRVLRLIRRYLEAGVLADGVVMERDEGTPQGGPLSPILANVLLDDVDKELERRGHAFVRYADDLNVYVRSERAGERVMTSLRKLFGKLKLRVNEAKSKVTRATKAKFLGFSFWNNRETTPARCTAGHQTHEGARARTDKAKCRAQSRAHVQTAADVPPRLEGLLPARGNAWRVCRNRRVGSPPAAGCAAQALEARSGRLPRADGPRNARPHGQKGRCQYPQMVVQLGDRAQHGVAERAFRPLGGPTTRQVTSTH
jgi:hypothetical protein